MFDSGMIDRWIRNKEKRPGLVDKLEDIGPEKLSMEHLDIAFKLIMIAFAICIIGFVAEIIYYRLQKMLK